MKSLLLSSLLLPLALAGVVPRVEEKVDYSGFKVLRLTLAERTEALEAQIEELTAHILNPGRADYLDVVVSPDKVDAVAALAAESIVITEDVGLAIEEEQDQISTAAGVLPCPPAMHYLSADFRRQSLPNLGSRHITLMPITSPF